MIPSLALVTLGTTVMVVMVAMAMAMVVTDMDTEGMVVTVTAVMDMVAVTAVGIIPITMVIMVTTSMVHGGRPSVEAPTPPMDGDVHAADRMATGVAPT